MKRTCKNCDGMGKVRAQNCRRCNGKGYREQPDPEPNGLELKPREEIVTFIEDLFDGACYRTDKTCTHFGRVELRELMDYLYDGPPTNTYQEVK